MLSQLVGRNQLYRIYVRSIMLQVTKFSSDICINSTLHGQIKGFNGSIITILFEVGSYRTVVG